ncbi:hypothetical protein LTR66_000026 [Elasticomyces elasticus]|nr:hypothetical protein LTR66_000026 [Elasticomyces elasticus]
MVQIQAQNKGEARIKRARAASPHVADVARFSKTPRSRAAEDVPARLKQPMDVTLAVSRTLKDKCSVHPVAFAMVVLDDCDDISVHSSNHIEWRHIVPGNVGERLRAAHASSSIKGHDHTRAHRNFCESTGSKKPKTLVHGGAKKVRAERSSLCSKQHVKRTTLLDKSSLTQRQAQLSCSDGEDTEDDDEEEETVHERARQSQSITIGNREEVTKFLRQRLEMIQQLPCKEISTAWLKAIVPKKQSHYPYTESNAKKAPPKRLQDGQKPRVLPFWPIDKVRYIEPHHLKKTERIELMLHLIRLRLTPEQFTEYNHTGVECPITHPLRESWVKFLQEATPASIEAKDEKDPARKERRREWLHQFYNVARMEEDVWLGGRHPEDKYHVPPEPAQYHPARKGPSSGRTRNTQPKHGRRKHPDSTPCTDPYPDHCVARPSSPTCPEYSHGPAAVIPQQIQRQQALVYPDGFAHLYDVPYQRSRLSAVPPRQNYSVLEDIPMVDCERYSVQKHECQEHVWPQYDVLPNAINDLALDQSSKRIPGGSFMVSDTPGGTPVLPFGFPYPPHHGMLQGVDPQVYTQPQLPEALANTPVLMDPHMFQHADVAPMMMDPRTGSRFDDPYAQLPGQEQPYNPSYPEGQAGSVDHKYQPDDRERVSGFGMPGSWT